MNHLKTVIARHVLTLCLLSTAAPLAAQRMVDYDASSGLTGSNIGGGLQDGRGLLWFATWNGLNCYDGYEFHRVDIRPGDKSAISTNHILDIRLSLEGNIWCHTDDGIYEFDLQTFQFRDIPTARRDSIAAVMGRRWHGITDTFGNHWTPSPQGLRKTSPVHHPAHLLAGTENERPRSFFVDENGRLWVSTHRHPGISIYEADGTLRQHIPLPTTPYVIFQHSSGDIWVGGKPGALMKLGQRSITPLAVYDIKEDRWGRLWVATYGGGVRCVARPQDDNPMLSESFGGQHVKKLVITPAGNIVAASKEGLLVGHIDERDYRKTRLQTIRRDGTDSHSLCSNSLISVAQDSKGSIYVLSESSGIDIISESSLMTGKPEITHLSTQNSALTTDMAFAMALQDDTLLMVAGADRVTALRPQTGEATTLSRQFWADTCRFVETTPLFLGDGSWLLGAEEGAFLATAHNIYSRGAVPSIVFTTLAIGDEADEFCLVPRSAVALAAHQRNVTIGFAAIDYTENKDILYRTRLDASPWTNGTSDRRVTLFSLSPGRHLLEVQSTDRYGRWVGNTRAITITVAPYWYETWWARLLFALAFAAVVTAVVYFYFYVRQLNRQRRELLEKYMALLAQHQLYDEPLAMENAAQPAPEPPADMPQSIAEGHNPEDIAFLGRVRRYIEENLSNPNANVDDMAVAAAASRSTLNRRLRSLMGISPAQLLIEARMQRAEQLFACSELKPEDIARQCGYADTGYFLRVYKKKHSDTTSVSPASPPGDG